jgi:hypothetical protein
MTLQMILATLWLAFLAARVEILDLLANVWAMLWGTGST